MILVHSEQQEKRLSLLRRRSSPVGGKWWSSFHCVVKQQAVPVDACIIEHARLIPLDWSAPFTLFIRPPYQLGQVTRKRMEFWVIFCHTDTLPHRVFWRSSFLWHYLIRRKGLCEIFQSKYVHSKQPFSKPDPKCNLFAFIKKFCCAEETSPSLCSFPADKTPITAPLSASNWLSFAATPQKISILSVSIHINNCNESL